MIRVVLFLASLVLNTGLIVTLAIEPTLAPPGLRELFSPARSPASASGVTEKPVPTSRQKLWAALDTGDDLAGLVARLRQAGFPPSIIRAVVSDAVSKRYDARLRALTEPDPSTPYWKATAGLYAGGKKLEQYYALLRERAKLTRDLFSDPYFATDDVSAAQRRRYGNLPRQKLDSLQRIEDDYSEMISQVRAASNGVLLADDQAKLALLQKERQADLATVLSPDELTEYNMRSSPLTRALARRLGNFDPSETEFRAIFNAQQVFGEKIANSGTFNGLTPEEQEAARQQLVDQLKSSLGPARFADYQRETDDTYQQLSRLAQNAKLSSNAALQAYSMQDTVAQESHRILMDAAMTDDEKRLALQNLAQTTRSQLLTILGPTVGPVYVSELDGRWLKQVENGAAVTFSSIPSNTIAGVSSESATGYALAYGNMPRFDFLRRSRPPTR